jgi:DNA-binding beta-propeller fold protein YncE
VVALGGKLYITDGNKDVIHVVDPAAPDGSRITRLVDLSSGGHKVLTGIAVGPDGNLYVANLTPAPFLANTGTVRRVTRTGSVTEVAGGFSAATGVALSPGGGLYVAEIASTIPQPPFLVPPGRIVTRAKEGVGPVAAPLLFPTILRWGPDGLYGTNFSVAGNNAEGALIRVGL